MAYYSRYPSALRAGPTAQPAQRSGLDAGDVSSLIKGGMELYSKLSPAKDVALNLAGMSAAPAAGAGLAGQAIGGKKYGGALGGAASGAVTGAQLGGPWGALAGGVIGGLLGG